MEYREKRSRQEWSTERRGVDRNGVERRGVDRNGVESEEEQTRMEQREKRSSQDTLRCLLLLQFSLHLRREDPCQKTQGKRWGRCLKECNDPSASMTSQLTLLTMVRERRVFNMRHALTHSYIYIYIYQLILFLSSFTIYKDTCFTLPGLVCNCATETTRRTFRNRPARLMIIRSGNE